MTEYYLTLDERDPSRWIGVPTKWPMPGFEKEFPDIPTWADVAANSVWNDSSLNPRPGELDELAGILAYAADRFPRAYPGFQLFLHLPDPRDNPLPVYLGDAEVANDPETELRHWTGAVDPQAVEPPIVEEFDSPHLGKGLRVLRYTVEPDGGVLAGLRYGWHIEQLGLQAYMFTVCPDTARLLGAMDDLDELARCMRYLPLER